MKAESTTTNDRDVARLDWYWPTPTDASRKGALDVFVADAGTDSLYQFSTAGLEGISPAPTATSLKWINVSFGGPGTTPTRFDGPAAVANLNNTLYICDRGNRRILRYRLARDLE